MVNCVYSPARAQKLSEVKGPTHAPAHILSAVLSWYTACSRALSKESWRGWLSNYGDGYLASKCLNWAL